ncbi:MAG: glutathione S-transferase [Myxococcales bacterium]|nr:glutathione S-transferase [Myxococcales bacterium]MBK7192126.1 glutathione S-transferase [Myxococcales bacterium]
MPNLRLYVGNRNYSSWSLRPWLCLTWSGLAFDTVDVDLDQPGYGHGQIADVLAVSPTGRIPALHVDDLVIWDSLAIAEWAAEAAPAAGLWPTDPGARAIARAVTAEMHAGFAPVRRDLPMNLRRRARATDLPPETRADIARIDALWCDARARFGGAGPYLFGARTIADAFYAPVATRFRTYAIELSPSAAAYRDALLADDGVRAWETSAAAQPATPFSHSDVDTRHPDA